LTPDPHGTVRACVFTVAADPSDTSSAVAGYTSCLAASAEHAGAKIRPADACDASIAAAALALHPIARWPTTDTLDSECISGKLRTSIDIANFRLKAN
jgi:hypothetical protein